MNSDQIRLKSKAIAEKIVRDLKDRDGFGQEWKQLTPTGQQMIRDYWQAIIGNELRGPARKVPKPRKK